MKSVERLASRLTPKRWPVRWRLAAVSATLTLIILVIFALVVGRLTSNRLHSDFNDDVRGTSTTLATQTQVHTSPFPPFIRKLRPQPQAMPLSPNSTVRYVYHDGSVVPGGAPAGAPDLGPPDVGHVHAVGGYVVASYPVPSTLTSPRPVYVEYARSLASIDATINRLWLFLALGIVGGTALAAIAGIAIAGRAMRPIANLTSAAREIASTRDPSRRVPQPAIDDEVGELARTLDQMLRQLDAARSETEQMMQLQREFVADASHELRTPL